MFFPLNHDLVAGWRRSGNWLVISSLVLLAVLILCCAQPMSVTQAATVMIDKLVTSKTTQQTVTQQTVPLAGARYQLQAVTPTHSHQRPLASEPNSYRPATGQQLFKVTLMTNQAGQAIYRNPSLTAGYYLLSEQVSANVPKPAPPVLIYFPDQGLAGTANDEFDYVPKSGLAARTSSSASPATGQATNTGPLNPGANAKIMQSSGRVWPSWLILVGGSMFLLIIGGVVFKLARPKKA